MIFATINEVQAHRFDGWHAEDSQAFNAINGFILRASTSRPDKLAALSHIAVKGMGMAPTTDADLDRLLKELAAG